MFKKKNTKLTFCALAAGLLLASCGGTSSGGTSSSSSSEEEPGELEFSLNEDGASYMVTGSGTYNEDDLIIPSTYEGLPVTSIDEGAFSSENYDSIHIPASITEIGARAFDGAVSSDCKGLYIEDLASWCAIDFGGTTANPLFNEIDLYVDDTLVNDLVIPSSVTTIKTYAFVKASITSLTMGDSVTSIENSAFWNCTSLASVTFGDGLTSIGNSTFQNCRSGVAYSHISIYGQLNSYFSFHLVERWLHIMGF